MMHRNNNDELSERSVISEYEPSLEMIDNKENIVRNILQCNQADEKSPLMPFKPSLCNPHLLGGYQEERVTSEDGETIVTELYFK
jgi:hypothetical protein